MRWLAPIVSASLCAACVNPVELNSAIVPSQTISDRSSEKAGVVCSPSLLAHIERAHPSTLA